MDTSFREHAYDGPQDFVFELAPALPDRAVLPDSRNLVGDLADVWLVFPGQATAENSLHLFALLSVAAAVRRFFSI